MSFWKSLFGGSKGGAEPAAKAVEYNGFEIVPAPYLEAGQFQTAGVISKVIDGARREFRFVRADRHTGRDEAISFSLSKARQIIDEQGDRLFG